MKRKFLGGLLASLAVMALPALASGGGQQQDQRGQSEVPNVLIVKVKVDKDGVQQSDGALVTPVRVQLQEDAEGQVDVQNMVQQANAAAQQAQSIDLQANQFQESDLPSAVQQVFQQAQQGRSKDAYWSWYSPYNNWGYYGYGYQPYWGYYNNAYPYYGYYYGGYTYPYTWSYYSSYPGYLYNYYYRW